jgi:AcrR family transcriptional regulator
MAASKAVKHDAVKAKDKILKAAIDEFVEYGFYGARTQRIANRAKVNKALLHYYYSSKEKIYEQVLQTLAGAVFDRLSTLSDDHMEPREKISQIIDVYIDVFTNYGDNVKIVLYEVMRGGGTLKRVVLSKAYRIAPTFRKFESYFKNEMKKGTIRKFSVIQLFISIMGQIAPVYVGKQVISRVATGLGIDRFISDAVINDRKKFVLDLIMYGIKKD